jgi:hypothetical protein
VADNVNHPKHYTSHPSGVECIAVTEHMNFNLGNAVKYVWRAGEKGDVLEDLRKARWYIEREIQRVEKEQEKRTVHVPLSTTPTTDLFKPIETNGYCAVCTGVWTDDKARDIAHQKAAMNASGGTVVDPGHTPYGGRYVVQKGVITTIQGTEDAWTLRNEARSRYVRENGCFEPLPEDPDKK